MKTNRKAVKRVLIADDSEMSRQLLTRLISREGVEVNTAVNGHDALKKVRDGYDLVLLDWQMPFVSGWEIVRQMRGSRRGEALDRVIMISGLVDGEGRVPAGVKFFPKPFDLEELQRVAWWKLGFAV